MSGVCPSTEPDVIATIWMYRANTCASGRNSKVREPGTVHTCGSERMPLRAR